MMRKLLIAAAICWATGLHAQPVITPPPFNPIVGVLPSYNDANWNWQNAGLAKIGGYPTRNTQCGATINPTGIVPPQASPPDDFNTITNAIAAANPATCNVIQLGTGTFNFDVTQILIINKSLTLRGSGNPTGNCTNPATPCWGTILQHRSGPWPKYTSTPQCGVVSTSVSNCPFGNTLVVLGNNTTGNLGWSGCQALNNINPQVSNCGTILDADVAQGATTIQVHSTANFVVGAWVLIDEAPVLVSTANPVGNGQANIMASSEFLNTSGSPVVMRMANPDTGSTACSFSFCNNRLSAELHLVTAIGPGPCPGVNCTLTFDDQVTMAKRQSGSHDGRAYWPTTSLTSTYQAFVQQAAIENLSITRTINSSITITFCAYCWVKNVEASYWIGGAVNIEYGARAQLDSSYFHDCIDCQNDGAEYPIGIDSASTEAYVVNNIIRMGGKGMVGRGANTAVVAYNFVDDHFYEAGVIGDYFHDMGLNGSHYAGTHHFLFEGNWATNGDNDETHGNAIYHTYFRNDLQVLRTPFIDPSNPNGNPSFTVTDTSATGGWSTLLAMFIQPQPLRAAGPMAFDYWMAYVGNVLGQSFTVSGNGFVYESTSGTKQIWQSGWTGSEWGNFPDANLNGASHRFIHRHCNYDFFHGSQFDCAAGFSTALPNSFYLPQKPAFFNAGANCTYPWPWVTPNLGTQIQSPTGPGNCSTLSGLPAKARWDAGTPFAQP